MTVNKPPLGWNSWNTFAKDINEQLICDSADALIASGLRDCGYEYIVIDDCWSLKERDENGRLCPDPEKFPHGMKYVADYVHSKGLKFGMYSCSGTLTCAGYPASYEHEWVDAQTFAEWGVDFLKYDYCFVTKIVEGQQLYRRMGAALANCGRDILFSACSWGHDRTHEWIKTTGASMWRSTGDIFDTWEKIKEIALLQKDIIPYGGIGCFNDMDMLIVGMGGKGHVGLGGCSFEEYKTHFSLWALLGSPLMIGCDIRNMDDQTKSILMNKDVIAVDQDSAFRQPFAIQSINPNDEKIAYARFLSNGDIAFGLFNMSDKEMRFRLTAEELGIPLSSGKNVIMKDLWSKEEAVMANGTYEKFIQPHCCELFRARIV